MCVGCFAIGRDGPVLFTTAKGRAFWENVAGVEWAVDDQVRVVQGCPRAQFKDGREVINIGPQLEVGCMLPLAQKLGLQEVVGGN